MTLSLRSSLLLFTSMLGACSSSEDSGPLQLGALYRGFADTTGSSTPASNYYLKFVDDETVLNTESSQSPAEVRAWFHRGEPNVNSEDYELNGNTVTINYGLASTFEGTIEGDSILFNVTLQTGSTYIRNFALVK